MPDAIDRLERRVQRLEVERVEAVDTAHADTRDQLGKLASLRDDGILTDEEFDEKKSQVAGNS